MHTRSDVAADAKDNHNTQAGPLRQRLTLTLAAALTYYDPHPLKQDNHTTTSDPSRHRQRADACSSLTFSARY
jgi:hypothetical protein